MRMKTNAKGKQEDKVPPRGVEPLEHRTTLTNLVEHNLCKHPDVEEKPYHKEGFQNTTCNIISRKVTVQQKISLVSKCKKKRIVLFMCDSRIVLQTNQT